MTLGLYAPDPRARGAGCPRNDYFVEWQIPDRTGEFIDLATGDTEVVLAEEVEVGSASGH